MIVIELIITAFFIGKLYQIKSIKDLPRWITIVFVVCLISVNTFNIFRYIRKVEALEKLVVEISKSKVEEVK
jgi:hypothetical protein